MRPPQFRTTTLPFLRIALPASSCPAPAFPACCLHAHVLLHFAWVVMGLISFGLPPACRTSVHTTLCHTPRSLHIGTSFSPRPSAYCLFYTHLFSVCYTTCTMLSCTPHRPRAPPACLHCFGFHRCLFSGFCYLLCTIFFSTCTPTPPTFSCSLSCTLLPQFPLFTCHSGPLSLILLLFLLVHLHLVHCRCSGLLIHCVAILTPPVPSATCYTAFFSTHLYHSLVSFYRDYVFVLPAAILRFCVCVFLCVWVFACTFAFCRVRTVTARTDGRCVLPLVLHTFLLPGYPRFVRYYPTLQFCRPLPILWFSFILHTVHLLYCGSFICSFSDTPPLPFVFHVATPAFPDYCSPIHRSSVPALHHLSLPTADVT